jgi:hypothetical protein
VRLQHHEPPRQNCCGKNRRQDGGPPNCNNPSPATRAKLSRMSDCAVLVLMPRPLTTSLHTAKAALPLQPLSHDDHHTGTKGFSPRTVKNRHPGMGSKASKEQNSKERKNHNKCMQKTTSPSQKMMRQKLPSPFLQGDNVTLKRENTLTTAKNKNPNHHERREAFVGLVSKFEES